jgi:hypothetical protein
MEKKINFALEMIHRIENSQPQYNWL